MGLVRIIINTAIVLFALWCILVLGLPLVIAKSPDFCARWKMQTGICGEKSFNELKSLSAWVDNNFPWAKKDINKAATLENAYKGLTILENSARDKFGNEKVDIALNNVDSGIKNTEVVINRGGFGDKIHDIPANAQKLVSDAKTALDRLRSVFEGTQRKTEDVTKAVDDTKKALDALSSALPSSK